ncbi:hypothetical protein EGW08_022696, partial [Elysia chlorotica]
KGNRTSSGTGEREVISKEENSEDATTKLVNGCPQGSYTFGDQCYMYGVIPETWSAARLVCRKLLPRGDLASIHSREELEFIQKSFQHWGDELVYIGLRKRMPVAPYRWSNGDLVQYLPWVPGCTGQELTGFAALDIEGLLFFPVVVRAISLPFLCSTKRVINSHRNEVQPAQNGKMSAEIGDGIPENNEDFTMRCREGWKSLRGKCYKAFKEQKTYEEAEAVCSKLGSNLLTLHSLSESKWLRQHIMVKDKNRRPKLLRLAKPDNVYWLGLKNGQYGLGWSDGSPLDYTNWRRVFSPLLRDGEPFHPMIQISEPARRFREGCFQINSNDLMWDGVRCEDVGYFICSAIASSKINPRFSFTNTTQRVGSTNTTPSVVSTNTTPRVSFTNTTPRIRSKNTTPFVGSTNITPFLGSTNTSPRVGSKDTILRDGSTTTTRLVESTNNALRDGSTNTKQLDGSTNATPRIGYKDTTQRIDFKDTILRDGSSTTAPLVESTDTTLLDGSTKTTLRDGSTKTTLLVASSSPTSTSPQSTMNTSTPSPRRDQGRFFILLEQQGLSFSEGSEGSGHERQVSVLVVEALGVVFVFAAIGVIIWRRQQRGSPVPWTSLRDSPEGESGNLQSERQPTRDLDINGVNQKGVYGTMG